MAAGNKQQQIREVDAVRQPCGERVRFEMVDRDERFSGRERQRLSCREANDDAADKPGAGRCGNAVDLGNIDDRVGKRAFNAGRFGSLFHSRGFRRRHPARAARSPPRSRHRLSRFLKCALSLERKQAAEGHLAA
jgi:hypothetical protein